MMVKIKGGDLIAIFYRCFALSAFCSRSIRYCRGNERKDIFGHFSRSTDHRSLGFIRIFILDNDCYWDRLASRKSVSKSCPDKILWRDTKENLKKQASPGSKNCCFHWQTQIFSVVLYKLNPICPVSEHSYYSVS